MQEHALKVNDIHFLTSAGPHHLIHCSQRECQISCYFGLYPYASFPGFDKSPLNRKLLPYIFCKHKSRTLDGFQFFVEYATSREFWVQCYVITLICVSIYPANFVAHFFPAFLSHCLEENDFFTVLLILLKLLGFRMALIFFMLYSKATRKKMFFLFSYILPIYHMLWWQPPFHCQHTNEH